MLRTAYATLLIVTTTIVSGNRAYAEQVHCDNGFELTEGCINHLGLNEKVATYKRMIADAQRRFGTSYKIRLRVVNNPVLEGYSADVGDVFTDVVRDEYARNESFIVNVTGYFLTNQPEILFEHSALHEVAHIINDDLTGYHRNGENVEVAEERSVFMLVGEARYRKFYRAYVAYKKQVFGATNEAFVERVKNTVLVPPLDETDELDILAAAYFRKVADGKEHFLVYNGELHEMSAGSTRDRVWYNPEKLAPVIKAGKPLIFFHNHPVDDPLGKFPSYDDFGFAAAMEFLVRKEHPDLAVEFRVMQPGEETTSVSYGFKKSVVEEICKNAGTYRDLEVRFSSVDLNGSDAVALKMGMEQVELRQKLYNHHLSRDSLEKYLQYVCPVDLTRKDPEVCRTHPQYFLWPSDKYFLRYRGIVQK